MGLLALGACLVLPTQPLSFLHQGGHDIHSRKTRQILTEPCGIHATPWRASGASGLIALSAQGFVICHLSLSLYVTSHQSLSDITQSHAILPRSPPPPPPSSMHSTAHSESVTRYYAFQFRERESAASTAAAALASSQSPQSQPPAAPDRPPLGSFLLVLPVFFLLLHPSFVG